ncbi:hypothetical protein DYB28_005307 [Aphanomyces astaci]|uniref:DDE-1 domain-containing protein n=1 Tax=Aphanomyces astaci TaxID=112090 RepID=A0A9X8DTY3_APHAT|nr:hypothetical protein DYB28_005307 [Aphanomyces astaci]
MFSAPVRKIVEDENIDVVYNADQTAVNYEYLPTKTLNKTHDTGDIVSWVADAWNDISTSTILNGFTKCQLVDGLPAIDDVDGGVLEDDVLAALMAT